MYFYSKKSSRKVVHQSHCHYYLKMDRETIGTFNTLEEANAAGYHLCKHCAPMGKYYRREKKDMLRFAVQNGLIYSYGDGSIDIETPYSDWRIITNGKQHKMFLYHKNTQNRKNEESIIPGYHSQACRSATIMGYMQFIVEHDGYRLHHPTYAPPQKKEAPRKGTKRYRKQQAKLKRRAKAASVRRVLDLIERHSCRDVAAIAC